MSLATRLRIFLNVAAGTDRKQLRAAIGQIVGNGKLAGRKTYSDGSSADVYFHVP